MFSFPPPPPPPPKASSPSSSYPGDQSYGDQRGRGRGRGSGRGGARGNENQRGHGQHAWRGAHSTIGPFQQPSGPHQYGQRQHVTSPDNAETSQQYGQYQSPSQVFPPTAFVNSHFASSPPRSNTSLSGVHQRDEQLQQDISTKSSTHNISKADVLPRTTAGHKRKLEALREPSHERVKKPGPETAPSIPSFGGPIVSTNSQLRRTSSKVEEAKAANKKHASKSLGLTPAANEAQDIDSDSDGGNEVDEEAMHAELGDKLTFEHNGVVMSLKSPYDLAEWKKQRRKYWPTRARMSEKEHERRKIGEERKRLLGGTKTMHEQPSQKHRSTTSRKPTSGPSSKPAGSTHQLSDANESPKDVEEPSSTVSKDSQEREVVIDHAKKLEDLRRRVAESEARNREAKANKDGDDPVNASSELTGAGEDGAITEVGDALGFHTGPDLRGVMDPDNTEKPPSESSSNLSSDSTSDPDPDEAPEEITSKPQAVPANNTKVLLCKYFAANGHCRDGDRCRFRHEPRPQQTKDHIDAQKGRQSSRAPYVQSSHTKSDRKGIFQRLVEQEQDEDNRLALKIIKYLGEAGLFSTMEDLSEE